MGAQPDYGSWVGPKVVSVPLVVGLLFVGLALISPWFLLGAVVFLVAAAFFWWVRRVLSPEGGDLQAQVYRHVMDRLDWDGEGEALDIGCGNGAVVVGLAKRHPRGRVTGIDVWRGMWGYSQETCQANARVEGVADRVEFHEVSAAALPYDDGAFDAVVSNFVFHEVGDVKDKRTMVKEALRVVRKGGAFAFQDPFLIKLLYGDLDDLMATIRGWGVDDVRFEGTVTLPHLPRLAKLPFALGRMGLIYGRK